MSCDPCLQSLYHKFGWILLRSEQILSGSERNCWETEKYCELSMNLNLRYMSCLCLILRMLIDYLYLMDLDMRSRDMVNHQRV
jgi:hypothetical protein